MKYENLIVLVQVIVGDFGEIDEIFDMIFYNKGVLIIRMLYQYIGDYVSYIQMKLLIL